MRAVVRLRSGINANIEVKDTLKHLRLHKVNHCVLVPEGETYDGMLQKVKDYVTWGEVKPEVLTNMMIKRGKLSGNRKFDNKYIKENTGTDSMLKFAEDLLHEIRQLQRDTEHLVISGSVKSMEHYKHLMGRLEGYQFVLDAIKERINKGELED